LLIHLKIAVLGKKIKALTAKGANIILNVVGIWLDQV
jgi:hypothetical protein